MGRVELDRVKVLRTAQQLATPLVRKTTREILTGAKRLVPKGSHMSGSGERRPGQSLDASLRGTVRVGPGESVDGTVGSAVRHAATVHQGSQAHVIHGRGKQLKFKWERGALLIQARRSGRITGRGRSRNLRMRGGFFFFSQVHHPGNKRPVRYLTTPMHQFGRANGFATSSLPVSRSRLP